MYDCIHSFAVHYVELGHIMKIHSHDDGMCQNKKEIQQSKTFWS